MSFRCRLDGRWTMLAVSEGCRRLTGYHPRDFLENPASGYATLISSDDLKELNDAVRAVSAEQRPLQSVHRLITREGRNRWVWLQGRLLAGESSETPQLEGFVTDVSEIVYLERRSERSKALLSVLHEMFAGAILVIDADGRIVSYNREFLRLWEIKEEELREGDDSLLLDRMRLHAENWEDFLALLTRLRERIEEEVHDFQVQLRSKRQLAISSQPIRDDDGTVLGRAWKFSERVEPEELRASQADKEAIIEAALDCVILMDHEGRILEFNPAAERTFGCRRGYVIGKPLADVVIPPDLRERHRAGVARYLETGASEILDRRLELTGQRSDGSRFPVELTVTRLPRRGSPVFAGFLRDISERKKAEERKIQITRQMLESQKLESIGVLAGGIAHDFNNILMAILANASLALLDIPESSVLRDPLKQVEEAARRGSDLTRQLLAYAGKGRFVVGFIDLNRLIGEMGNLLRVTVSKNVTIRYDLARELPTIEADATQIRQIIMNLLLNASEAIGSSPGIVTVATGIVSADREYLDGTYAAPELPVGDYVFLEVSDTGRGIPPDVQAHMFDPFFSTKSEGRGMGLSAVLGIVRGHKGTLKVYSEMGKGTAFKILLPAQRQAADSWESGEKPASVIQGHGNVLVVDDELAVRAAARKMLERFGFTVLLAEDGERALQILGQNMDIRCILLDLTMPRMGGAEALREILRLNPKMKIILMSGYNSQDTISRFAGKGLAGFLQKPFTPLELSAKLEEVLD
ncbi:MAG: PAS domain S-box protein [Bdellovibrionota bacterium]